MRANTSTSPPEGCQETGGGAEAPEMALTPGNAGRRYPAEPLAPEDVRLLLRAVGRRGPCAARNEALLWALWRTGARIGELLALRPHHVENDAVRIVARLKGGH